MSAMVYVSTMLMFVLFSIFCMDPLGGLWYANISIVFTDNSDVFYARRKPRTRARVPIINVGHARCVVPAVKTPREKAAAGFRVDCVMRQCT